MPDRALRPVSFSLQTLAGILFESINARQGIKTDSVEAMFDKSLGEFESINARQGIKTDSTEKRLPSFLLCLNQ